MWMILLWKVITLQSWNYSAKRKMASMWCRVAYMKSESGVVFIGWSITDIHVVSTFIFYTIITKAFTLVMISFRAETNLNPICFRAFLQVVCISPSAYGTDRIVINHLSCQHSVYDFSVCLWSWSRGHLQNSLKSKSFGTPLCHGHRTDHFQGRWSGHLVDFGRQLSDAFLFSCTLGVSQAGVCKMVHHHYIQYDLSFPSE
jgi:hypothetical protein